MFHKITIGTVLLGLFLQATQSAQSSGTESISKVTYKSSSNKSTEKSISSPPQKIQTPKDPPVLKGWLIGVRAAYVPSIIGEIGYQFNQTFKLRMMGIGGRYFQTYSVDGQKYNHIRFQNFKIAFMADWHPWKNGFRLTGGLSYNGNKIRLNHTVTGNLLGQSASVYGTIKSTYDFRNIAPYLGIGYDTETLGGSGIVLSLDAGFWIQGKAHADVSLSGSGQNNSTTIYNTRIHLEKLLNKKLIRNLPMISLGLRYMF